MQSFSFVEVVKTGASPSNSGTTEVVREWNAIHRSAIRYWERRRIVYNIALVPPAVLTYVLAAGVMAAGDERQMHPFYAVLWFGLSALAANVCFTFCYALEFIFGGDNPGSRWIRIGRPLAFGSGLLLGLMLSILGGRNIAWMEFSHR